jgi:hypothetical protein
MSHSTVEAIPAGTEVVSLREYMEMQMRMQDRFNAERDRRYSEVNTEREKALKIKETADLRALNLADEIQKYKDEKANELRSQIERERGTYATQQDLKGVLEKMEIAIKPLTEFVAHEAGRTGGRNDSRLDVGLIVQILAFLAVACALVFGKG